ncbi:hypothetical protein [Paractinoplanes toevensis]|uniref:Uncharacterized protein n=1 Tax=Paractinoplanes toevensis TaxID=571911 RepID=A0A919T435_9ACTN|nr:hypothetical protein [Actinoplanes toevensis]GIM88853.1 hypothetical protein Ato02nite_006460 [Actinoplanes toevensis]
MARYETVQVTPRIAKQWLGKNVENNRLPKGSKIPAYARDMISGNWQGNTGETIKFDPDGNLIDGQNRLRAVVMAGVPVTFDVAYDVPAQAMQVVDTGAARTASDVLRIAGVADRMRCSAIVRWAIMWDAKVFMGRGGTHLPTTSEVIDRYMAEPGLFDAASKRATDCQNRGLGAGAPAGLAYYLFASIDSEQTHQFFDQYISGANLPNRSAVLALRNKIARSRIDRITRAEQLALFIRAWNAFRDGKPVDRLQLVKSGDLTNLNFPQPK